MTDIDIQEVTRYLPQRYPFLFIDKIIEYTKGERLVAIKNLTINELFFQGHFPQKPVMPGVLIIEALAQAGCVLAFLTSGGDPEHDDLYLFAGVDKARFRRVVVPGDQLRLEVNVIRARRDVWKVRGEASVNGEIACSTEIMSIRSGENT